MPKRFTEHIEEEKKKDPDNIFDPPTEPQLAVNFLQEYLLGENWYVAASVGPKQVNTAIVHEILYKYSKKYRKEYKAYIKKSKKC